ncbi:MarR family transcriptional regulator [Pseudanabaena sp. FACHB-2040]|uniref:MarR family winged helix-turn-helix transcriptional regulator n=1 Tax=Pseudanabaena sp. FACHB-2040 TaxID=2692859 RepID=UPI001683F603|nr:MarR family transcriptional regulator [Pseudanabaena sp. FACHB-2040]MBD2255950.1 MarR family transcriptional regulator [Pseudanabaena sp. FACHB-2040]
MNLESLPIDAPNPEDFAGFLIWQLSNKWEKYVNQKLKEFDINQGECFHLISILQLSKKLSEVTQVDIAHATGGSIMNTSKILKSLEKKQWITRRTASDSRAKKVTVTEAGIAVSIDVAKVLGTANQDFYSTNHTQEFIAILQKINQIHSHR